MGLQYILSNLPMTVEPAKRRISLEDNLEYYVSPSSMALDECMNFQMIYNQPYVSRTINVLNSCIIDNCYPLYKYDYFRAKNHKSSGYYLELDYSYCVYREFLAINPNEEELTELDKVKLSRSIISYVRGIAVQEDIDRIQPYIDLVKPTLQNVYNHINQILDTKEINIEILSINDFRMFLLYKGNKMKVDIKKFRLGDNIIPNIYKCDNNICSDLRRLLYA